MTLGDTPSPSAELGGPLDQPATADLHQLRLDTWTRLRTLTGQVATTTRRGGTDLRQNLFELTRPTRLSKGAVVDPTDVRGRIRKALETLRPLESYFAFPGSHAIDELVGLEQESQYEALATRVADLERSLANGTYRARSVPYFEVLVVDPLGDASPLEPALQGVRGERDRFVYDVVCVSTFEDALIGILFNDHVQACVVRSHVPFRSSIAGEQTRQLLVDVERQFLRERDSDDPSLQLARAIRSVRPELDLYWVTDTPVEEMAGHLRQSFRRVFYGREDHRELHLSILKGIGERYDTPFFTALRNYSQKPTGGFHALPVARGKSIAKSHWIRDLGEFYGDNVFLAETSATGGGLDSLLQPQGPLKQAQQLAARAFGARRTYFCTNGTSTANKIVVQGLVSPGDIVLVARDCHKSHHYALLLVGALPLYLDAYPLSDYTMYGAVPLASIKDRLLALRTSGELDRVRMVLLTSCTFDGLTYDPVRVMHEVLAIKPDIVFLWDEAWFAYAGLSPRLRRRTAMAAAAKLRERYRSDAYRREYAAWHDDVRRRGLAVDDALRAGTALPDPDAVRVRVYATHSTHKTLTAFRQGSMIHVHDQDFEANVAEPFHAAYMTHTSTSPNYQILASLDAGRRQAELEGYELVERSVQLALSIRERLGSHPLLRKYFTVLGPAEMIPAELRPSGLRDHAQGTHAVHEAWQSDELVLDPTRITLHIGRTGMDGDTLRRRLIEEFDIQINKTSRNTVLFMIHIGMNRGTAAYLIEVLSRIAEELEQRQEDQSAAEHQRRSHAIRTLTDQLPALPTFGRFHSSFAVGSCGVGDTRKAFFLAYDTEACEHLALHGAIEAAMASGRELVSAGFITPYPPGTPLLLPGQVISEEIVAYLKALDVREIHGYDPQHGIRVFTEAALAR